MITKVNALTFSPSKRSIADVLYAKDAIVVCRNPECGKPLYRLQRSIYAHEPVGDSTWKYAPVSVSDIVALLERQDLEPGQRAHLRTLSLMDWHAHCNRIPELKPDAMADCPACKESFVFGRVRDDDEGSARFGDKGYVIKLAVIPPPGQSRRIA